MRRKCKFKKKSHLTLRRKFELTIYTFNERIWEIKQFYSRVFCIYTYEDGKWRLFIDHRYAMHLKRFKECIWLDLRCLCNFSFSFVYFFITRLIFLDLCPTATHSPLSNFLQTIKFYYYISRIKDEGAHLMLSFSPSLSHL